MATSLISARRRRPLARRILRAALVFRLELRPPDPLDAGLILLSWLHRPVIEMPLQACRAVEGRAERLRQRLDEVFPF
ncbi:MAG: hypothetical protein QF689_13740 [Candidatus Latescibacteria bacterium]|nr:hypothetical protein [Gemmatimonadaceae bacterium]MDP6014475.1 hypothetical protein [Candidatus Latescibacterota bacterium]MDP7449649.1 hypothetical protein [Candidatus Latescibacterota bacterium]HJP31405.1 hypothetical protein [Candidatus Latescibacterota bacterium]